MKIVGHIRSAKASSLRFFYGLLLGLSLAASLSHGHPQFALSTVNRYGRLVLGGPGGARLFYTLMIGDIPAYALRRQADRNGDGQLDAAEQQELSRTLLEQTIGGGRGAGIALSLDGKPLALAWEAPLLSMPDPRVSPLAFSFELSSPLSAAAAAPPAEHVLRYEDRVALEPVGDVELRIEEGPGARVLAAWEGASPPKPPALPSQNVPVSQSGQSSQAESGARPIIFAAQGPPRSSLSDRSVSVRFTARSAGRSLLPGSIWRRRFDGFNFLMIGFAGGATVLIGWLLARAIKKSRKEHRLAATRTKAGP